MAPRFNFNLKKPRNPFLRFLLVCLIAIPCTLYIILAYLIPSSPALIPPSLLASKRPIFITAHPDDESLFFGPTILQLASFGSSKKIHILVLSTGNNYGLGDIRKEELEEACTRIGASECKVLDRSDIRDNPKMWWDGAVVTPIISSWVEKWKADAVITFDSNGISGHINHRAVSSAVVNLAKIEPEFPPTFVLQTVATFIPPRKYIGILDLPLTSLRFTLRILVAMLTGPRSDMTIADIESWKAYDDQGLFVSSLRTWRQNVHAFWAHGTQTSWDRSLYMFVSRYMWFNNIKRIHPETRHEKPSGNEAP